MKRRKFGRSDGEEEEEEEQQIVHKARRVEEVAEDEEEEEEEGNDNQEEEEQGGMDGGNGDEEDDEEDEPERVLLKPIERIRGTYAVGSLVRITLVNFVTYDHVTFTPGPDLNMIIGPNGTGKSSIVCAIALGLAGKPELLGRQKEYRDFVKRGKEDASIEIELKGQSDATPNYIIKRILKASSNNTSWKLNGVVCSERKIKETIRKLDVHVDNLCQFLPQDKVCEFAQMTPQILLTETQHAAGEPEMTDWHQALIRIKHEKTAQEAEVGSCQNMVNELDRKNQAIEREVARYRERVAVLAKVKMLEKAIAGRQFEEAKSMYLAAKEGANFIKLRYQAVEAQVKPLKDAYNQALSAYNRIKEEPKKVKEEYNKTANSVDKLYDDNAKLEDSSEDVHVKLRSLDKKEREKQVAITKLNAEIRSLTQSVETLREVHANSNAQRVTIDGEIEEIAEKRRVLNTSNGELQFKLATSKDTADHLKRTREQLQHQLVELKKVKTQKLNAMRRFDESTARAYEWLEQGNNRSRFKGPVVGPISMEISAKEPKYALYLENAIGYNNLKMFLTTCSEDYKLLLRETERMNLRINVACPKEDYLTKSYPRPLNPTQLNQLGFEGLAIDFVEGPDNVLKFLCLTCYLFCVPISTNPNANVNEREIEQINQRGLAVKRYMVKQQTFNINSRYGASSTSSQKMKPRVQLLSQSVDNEAEDRLTRELQENEQAFRKEVAEYNSIASDLRKITEEFKTLEERRKTLLNEKKALNEINSKITQKLKSIEMKESKLESMQEGESLEDERAKLNQEIKEIFQKRVNIMNRIKGCAQQLAEQVRQRTLALLNAAELEAVALAARRAKEQHDQALENVSDAMRRALEEKEEAKRQASMAKEKAEGLWKDNTDEEENELQEVMKRDMEELEDDLNTYRARADLADRASANVVQQYERRKEEIAVKNRELEEKKLKLNVTTEKMQAILDNWLPKLEALVNTIAKTFSEAFDRINCSGDVRLNRSSEDYSQWGIEILVKFRDTERLQVLTGQRQSGGERSVSTILYLMSLQQLSRAPFRVVDEINQGMDPRNERMIHSQLVETACSIGKSQYFLITPKLLPDLVYNDAMRVSCVFNGENQPGELSLAAALDKHRRYLSAASAFHERGGGGRENVGEVVVA